MGRTDYQVPKEKLQLRVPESIKKLMLLHMHRIKANSLSEMVRRYAQLFEILRREGIFTREGIFSGKPFTVNGKMYHPKW